MPEPALAPLTRTCVWMDAGLISYRLCNRAFDCDRCLLNAALCGDTAAPSHIDPACAGSLPDDRVYCPGHTWIRSLADDPARWRFGLDPFAASILGQPLHFSWPGPAMRLQPGDTVCTIAVGDAALDLPAPASCRFVGPNPTLLERPGLLLSDPCEAGWIAEIELAEISRLVGFLSAPAASQRIAADLTRFRRELALELLTGGHATTPHTTALPGQTLADVPRLLGPSRYLRLLLQFIH